MLLSFRDLERFEVYASDGVVGTVRDVLFDDRTRAARYVVVDTGQWLRSHPVLLVPDVVETVTIRDRIVRLGVDRERVEKSPTVATDPPVSRHAEDAVRAYFGLPPLAAEPPGRHVGTWGEPVAEPTAEAAAQASGAGSPVRERAAHDPHLRSARELMGYGVEGIDGHIGTVDDLLFDADGEWSLRFFVVDTGGWLTGKRRLVAADWVTSVSYPARHVRAKVGKARVAEAPDFETSEEVDHGAERWLYEHYGFTRRV